MSVPEKISQDVENLFYSYLIQDFKDVSEAEYVAIKSFVPLLKRVYPEEYIKAVCKYKKIPYSKTLKK